MDRKNFIKSTVVGLFGFLFGQKVLAENKINTSNGFPTGKDVSILKKCMTYPLDSYQEYFEQGGLKYTKIKLAQERSDTNNKYIDIYITEIEEGPAEIRANSKI